MTDWVRMKHNGTGGHTLVPSQAVAGYEKRGWTVQTEDAKPAPKPRPIRSSKVQEVPTPSPSDNDIKEDG